MRAQLVGTGLATSPAPFTVAQQTAVLTLVQNLLPPLFLGLGPQWGRIQGFQSDPATNTTDLSLLFDSIVPPIWNDTSDTFPQVRLPDRCRKQLQTLANTAPDCTSLALTQPQPLFPHLSMCVSKAPSWSSHVSDCVPALLA